MAADLMHSPLFSNMDSESDGFSAGGDSRDSDSDCGIGRIGGIGDGGGGGGDGGSDSADPVHGSISAWVGLAATPPAYRSGGGGGISEAEVRKCLSYFREARQVVGSFDRTPLQPLSPEDRDEKPSTCTTKKSAVAGADLRTQREAFIASLFDRDPIDTDDQNSNQSPAAGSFLGKRRRLESLPLPPPPPLPAPLPQPRRSPSAGRTPASVAHCGGLNLQMPLSLLPAGNNRHSNHWRRSHRRRDLGIQTEEAQQQQPASRPTAAVPPVPAAAAAATEAAQLQQLSITTDRAQASRAAALERQWRSTPLETLLHRAKAHKRHTDAAIKAEEADAAKRHFLRAGVLFLAGCWAEDERRRTSAAAGEAASSAAGPTRQTYREIATFVRQFVRQLMRNGGGGGGGSNGRKPTAADSLADLSMLMLLSVVEYRQYYCYRQELANHSAAMKNGNLAADQREQFLGHLLHLYHATETWAHMIRTRDKLLTESPDLSLLEDEAVRLCGFRPAGPADRLSHQLAYLQAAADVLGGAVQQPG